MKKLFLFALLGFLSLPNFTSQAEVLLSHEGSNNPLTEGWVLETYGTGSPSTVLAAFNDGGEDTWRIQNAAGTQTGRYYSGSLDAGAMANAKLTGFEITLQVRGLSNSGSEPQAVWLSDGTAFWELLSAAISAERQPGCMEAGPGLSPWNTTPQSAFVTIPSST